MNTLNVDFRAEELEPRMEMQMLGLGADPGIVIVTDDEIIIIIIEITDESAFAADTIIII